MKYRFHLFVKLQIISINDNIAVVNYKEISDLIRNVSKMISEVSPLIGRSKPDEEKMEHQSIKLQNMDSYFFLNDNRKKKMEKQLQLYQLKMCISTLKQFFQHSFTSCPPHHVWFRITISIRNRCINTIICSSLLIFR
jgi:hypothetical protein